MTNSPAPQSGPSISTLSDNAKIALAVITIIATAVLLFVVDLAAWSYLGAQKEQQYSLLWRAGDDKPRRETVFDRRLSQGLNVLDPHLGYARPPGGGADESAWRWPGFKTSGDRSDNAKRVIILGGSTSDPFYADDWGVWSDTLLKRFTQNAKPTVVFNGAVSGYSTNQEVLKLLRDGAPLAPDIVISLSGVNDLNFSHSLRDHPMVSPYQAQVLSSLTGDKKPARFMPNLMAAMQKPNASNAKLGTTKGVKTSTPDHEMWRRNIEMMHAISTQMGARFYVFLQPTMGVDKDYKPDPDEAALYEKILNARSGYEDQATAFYTAARRHCAELSYCFDISSLFSGKSGLYHDPRHPNHDGNALIGDQVFEIINQDTN